MAITVSGSIIIFDDTSVAQASLYNETFGTGIFPEGGTSLLINPGTSFNSSATAGNGTIKSPVGVKTEASVIFTTPQSGSVTVNPIVSGVYVFAVGGGGGGGGATNAGRVAGGNGTPTFFATVIGYGGSTSATTTGGIGGTATGGTTNTSGTNAANRPGPGDGGNAGGYPTTGIGTAGLGFPAGFLTAGDGTPGLEGGGGGGAANVTPLLVSIGAVGGGGGGLAIHTRLTITGGSPYSYQVGAGGTGGASPAAASGGAGGNGYLKFILYD